jgi:hypothetical protein
VRFDEERHQALLAVRVDVGAELGHLCFGGRGPPRHPLRVRVPAFPPLNERADGAGRLTHNAWWVQRSWGVEGRLLSPPTDNRTVSTVH